MPKTVGISRVKRKPISLEKNLKSNDNKVNKSEKKPLSELFSDIDLTDVSIIGQINHLNSDNVSFKFTTSFYHLNQDKNESNINSITNSSQCLSNQLLTNVNESEQNNEKIQSNDNTINAISKSFESLSKSFNTISHDNINDLNTKQNIVNNKRKNTFELFEDIDLSDLKCDNFDKSFQLSRKAFKKTNQSIETHENSSTNVENQSKSHKDLIEIKVCSNSPPKDEILEEDNYSFDSQENAHFLNCVEKHEQTLNETKNTVNYSEVKNSTTLQIKETSEMLTVESDDSNDENDLPFILRSDYCTFGEEKFNDFENDCNNFDCIESIENKDFMGFRRGNGQLINVSEADKMKARLLFDDIEEVLLNDINEERLKLSSSKSFSQTIATNPEISVFNTSKDSNEENLFHGNINSKFESSKSTEDVTSSQSPQFKCSSYQFKPLTCYPSKQINKDRVLYNSSLFENSIKESMIPCTSTPKSSNLRRIKFEPKKSIPFAHKLNDI